MLGMHDSFISAGPGWGGSVALMSRQGPWQRYKHAVRMCMVEAGWASDCYRPVKEDDGSWSFQVLDVTCTPALLKAMALCRPLLPTTLI